jgi:mycobactin peptide synthetase MbtE
MALAIPEAIAIRSSRATITYGELDRAADAWAAQLVADGVGVGHCVPIALPKSPKLVIALLAVLKTGAAYALTDPSWPTDRVRDVVDQLDARLLVTERGSVDGDAGTVWTPSGVPVGARSGFEPVGVPSSHPCCVFFTSGTTGRPKGVLTPHGATARLFRPGTFARFDADTVIPLAAPMPWDAFSLELWSALLNGGTSVLVDEPYLSAEWLRSGVSVHGVNTVWLTSSLFNMIVDEDLDAFRGVRQLMIGGERLSPTHVGRFLRRHPAITLLNGYGPVESTVFATVHRITPRDCERRGGIPLGRPVPGTTVFVLDGVRRCAAGEVGEICIGGDGLALRYLGDPELTRAKFPHVELDGERLRLYRTGDLGLWDEEGLLHFRGRTDRQLKVRGHRVEPAEIERQVERLLPSVLSCRVLARRDELGAAQELVAFCVPRAPGDPLEGALSTLQSALVKHQLPVAVVSVPRFPVTAQGKLDERALLATAEPAATDGSARASAVRLRDATARLVAETFAAVLGRVTVPLDVPFFELGGSSLGAGRVCARLATRLARPVPVSWLYQDPTVAALAARLASAGRPEGRPKASGERVAVPLTPMQLVFLTRHLADPADRTGHCLLTWEIHGELHRAALASAIAAVHERHEPLRAAYVADPRPAARLVDLPPPPLEVLGAQPSVAGAVSALRDELGDDLEVGGGEVWRSALVPVEAEKVTLLGLVVHHIAFDGWSETILTEDLAAAYNAAAAGREPAPPSPPCSALADAYDAHVERLAYVDLEAQREQLLADLADVPDMRWPDGETESRRGTPGHVEVSFDLDLLAAVDAVAAESGVTRFVVLLHGWARSLAGVTSQRDLAIGVPVAQRYSPGLERAVGCHINMLCIRLRGAALGRGAAGIRETGRTVGRSFAAQDVPFADLALVVSRRRSGRPPLFQTLFSLHDNPPARLELDGLRTTFLPQPYVDLPLELVADVWPDDAAGPRLAVSFRREVVPEAVGRGCALRFEEELRSALPGGSP